MFMIYVLSSMLESCMLDLILVMINLVRNLNLQLSIFPIVVVRIPNVLIGMLQTVKKSSTRELSF